MPDSAYLALFLVGLLGGTHCVGMCGGIVGALSLGAPARSNCPQCGAPKVPHRVCGSCGTYRKRTVIETEEE